LETESQRETTMAGTDPYSTSARRVVEIELSECLTSNWRNSWAS
jgi:hypothetical protein